MAKETEAERLARLEKDLAAIEAARQEAIRKFDAKERRTKALIRHAERKANPASREWENHKKYLLAGNLLRLARGDGEIRKLVLDAMGQFERLGDWPAVDESFDDLLFDLKEDFQRLEKAAQARAKREAEESAAKEKAAKAPAGDSLF